MRFQDKSIKDIILSCIMSEPRFIKTLITFKFFFSFLAEFDYPFLGKTKQIVNESVCFEMLERQQIDFILNRRDLHES